MTKSEGKEHRSCAQNENFGHYCGQQIVLGRKLQFDYQKSQCKDAANKGTAKFWSKN